MDNINNGGMLLKLDDDVFRLICSMLTVQDRMSVALTCLKLWNRRDHACGYPRLLTGLQRMELNKGFLEFIWCMYPTRAFLLPTIRLHDLFHYFLWPAQGLARVLCFAPPSQKMVHFESFIFTDRSYRTNVRIQKYAVPLKRRFGFSWLRELKKMALSRDGVFTTKSILDDIPNSEGRVAFLLDIATPPPHPHYAGERNDLTSVIKYMDHADVLICYCPGGQWLIFCSAPVCRLFPGVIKRIQEYSLLSETHYRDLFRTMGLPLPPSNSPPLRDRWSAFLLHQADIPYRDVPRGHDYRHDLFFPKEGPYREYQKAALFEWDQVVYCRKAVSPAWRDPTTP